MNISIHPIRMNLDTMYVLKGEGVILVDGGDPDKLENFKRGIARASIRPEEIKLILLTHGHWDHLGSAAEIQGLTGAKILLHQADLHFLDEAHPSQPPGFTTWGKFIIKLISLATANMVLPKFTVDIVAGSEDISLSPYGIAGKVVHTPGHSWGSVSVLLDSGEAFVGDLGMNMFPLQLGPGLPIFGDDMQLVKQSWNKLIGKGAKVVYPAHGKPFPIELMQKAILH